MKDAGTTQKTPEALMDELRAIVGSNVAGNIQLLTRLSALVTNTARAASTMPTSAPDPSRVVAQSLEAILESSAVVNRHTLAALNELVTVAEQALAAAPTAPSARNTATGLDMPADLHLEGRIGSQVSGRFAIDNEYDSPVQVSFSVAGPAAGGGTALPIKYVTLEPTRAVIPAKGTTTVGVTIDAAEELIVGRTYAARIRVVGFEAPDVNLRFTVLGAAPAREGALVVTRSGRGKRPKRRSGNSP